MMITLFSKYILPEYEDKKMKLLDVGSCDVQNVGNYRDMFTFKGTQKLWSYEGLDIAPGKNVDIVTKDCYNWPLKDGSYDVVISGQCLEHVEAPWMWAREVERVIKKDGTLIVIVPWKCNIHRYPVDCWRILPDGFKYLFGTWTNFNIVETNVKGDGQNDDCFVVAKRN